MRAFTDAPPVEWASAYATEREAHEAGLATGRALRDRGVDVDLAPVLDASSGPLGAAPLPESCDRRSRLPAASPREAWTRVRSTSPVSAPRRPRPTSRSTVPARLVPAELAAFRAAVESGIACVMTGHAVYAPYGSAGRDGAAARMRTLRRWGFDGVVITDSLNVVSSGPWSAVWARRAALAGADLLLFTSPEHARRAISALLPLARRGDLDEAVRRVLALRASHGLR